MQRYPVWHLRHQGSYDQLADVILANRSLAPEDISDSPSILHDPMLMRDMPEAVARLLQAIRRHERIVVFGDYDVDGVTSTALLLDFLDRVGADATFLIPERFRDGYGMKPAGVRRAIDKGAKLVVTADNGISSFEAVDEANAAGVDVVVVDHHQPQDRLPAAVALVNPSRPDCGYPFKGLAAVGVAFKVVQALSGELMAPDERRPYLNSLLDLFALGTVSDVAPMVGENRLLTRRGLQVLDREGRPGVEALKSVSGSSGRTIDTTAIAFFLGPRLNCAGRLASAALALNLLRSTGAPEASRLAAELNTLNTERQDLQSRGLLEAEEMVEREGLAQHRLLMLQGDEWHLGVVGLLAGRLCEKYWRPTLVCTDYRKNGIYTGSARSAGGYNMIEAIFRYADLLTEYGGHADAAGFSVPAENYAAFRQRMTDDASERLSLEDLEPRLELDVALRPRDISLETVSDLSRLSPFGASNEAPLFVVPGCRVERAQAVGKGSHLKLELHTGHSVCDAIWWRQGDLVYELFRGDRVDVAFALEPNTWNGQTRVQMVVEDLRPAQG